ncbi:MAG: hypothetical protein V3S68_04675 [Dehalococcoidia bacterium]
MINTTTQTIIDQIGGSRFQTMTGVKQIAQIKDGVQFNFGKGSQGINTVLITLNERDTYDLKFWRITAKTAKEIVGVGDIHAGELQGVFTNITGLDTKL